MNKQFLIVLTGWWMAFHALASIRVTAEASPTTVAVGEAFRLEYKVNSTDAEQIRPDAFNGVEVLNGPAVSTFSSYQLTNGRASSESSTTFTYILSPTREGTLTLPAATVSVGGRHYKSNAVRIKVVKGSGQPSRETIAQENGPAMRTRGAVTNKDLFITVTANKTQVFEQEPIVLTYKVYTLVNLNQLVGKMPDLKGFLSQEVPLPQQKTFAVERYGDKLYRTTTWSQYVMFPQQTGKLTVPSIRFEGAVTMENPNIDPIDAFFNGYDYTVKVVRQTPTIDIEVSPLPTPKPKGFSGAVGDLKIRAEVATREPKTNEALTVRVTISGVGNMKLIKAPKLTFPTSFEVYDPKITDKTKLTAKGIAGEMVYDYLVIPRQKGHYDIPPVEFSYFDINTGQYKTLQTQPLAVDVAQGTKSDADVRKEMELRQSDIRALHVDDGLAVHTAFWESGVYGILYVILLVVFAATVWTTRRYIKANADIVGRRGRAAGKNARLRLAKAKAMLDSKKRDAFYDETEKALQGYVADKFNIPQGQLSRETVTATLTAAGVTEETVGRFNETLEGCEFARFAPSGGDKELEGFYEQVAEILSRIEQELKAKKKK